MRTFKQILKANSYRHGFLRCIFLRFFCDKLVDLLILYYYRMFSMDSALQKKRDYLHAKKINSVPQEQDVPNKVKNYLKDHFIKNYSTSQSFFYLKTITDLVEKKEKDPQAIKLNDNKFNEEKEHFQKFYHRIESTQELPQLFQYYKYYTQEALCFLNREFSFLAVHHERKKAALYFQLKKQLNITDSDQSLSTVTKNKDPKEGEVGNVLSGLSLSLIKSNDESYCINETLKKLTKYFGPPTKKPIDQIDSQFKFMAHVNKQKNLKVQSFLQKKSKIPESTNTSLRNPTSNQRYTKGSSHKRYISCQLTVIPPKNESNTNLHIPKKSKNLKRRKSADFLQSESAIKYSCKPFQQISSPNTCNKPFKKDKLSKKEPISQNAKIPLIKKNKESPLVTMKTSTTYMTQITLQKQKQRQIKNTIQNLRTQIRKQKENIYNNSSKKGTSYKKIKK